MKTIISIIVVCVALLGYTLVGSDSQVDTIRKFAPVEIAKRNWTILRYEGYEYGSWGNHGGKVWYHVANTDNPSIQYRVFISIWKGELQYHYGAPEKLQRIEVEYLK